MGIRRKAEKYFWGWERDREGRTNGLRGEG